MYDDQTWGRTKGAGPRRPPSTKCPEAGSGPGDADRGLTRAADNAPIVAPTAIALGYAGVGGGDDGATPAAAPNRRAAVAGGAGRGVPRRRALRGAAGGGLP